MTSTVTDRPGTTRDDPPADAADDPDERRIRALVDAIRMAGPARLEAEEQAREAALRAILDEGEVASDRPGSAR